MEKNAVPAGLNPPDRVAESLAKLFTTIVAGERVVANVGVALLTVRSSQALNAGLLFGSPLYVAFQLYRPAAVNLTDREFGMTPLVTVTGVSEVWMLPVQPVAFQYS